MKSEELKPCPFCGEDVKVEETEGGDCVIRCSCDAHMFDDMDWGKEAYDAVVNITTKWNRRKTDD